MSKELSEKEQRAKSAVAGEGAPSAELELDPKDQNKEVAGEPAEQKADSKEEKAKEEDDKKAVMAKNQTSTTAAVNTGTK